MSAHALLAPSSAHRWIACPGSIAASLDVKDSGSSHFAREGTAAHILAQRALECGRPAEFFRGEEIVVEEDGTMYDFVVDDEMIDNVQVYIDAVMREPGELLVEQKFDLSEVYGVENQFGTGDAVKLDYDNERLYVGDLKYGKGVTVYAKDNPQLYSYGAGALLEYDMLADWKTITVAVLQPRIGHYDEYTLKVSELRQWMAKTKTAAQKAFGLCEGASDSEIEAAKVAGDKQCQWCPVKGNCQALANWAHEQVFDDFTDLAVEPEQVREATGLDSELLGQLLHRVDTIEGAVKAWRIEAHKRVEAGIDVPGWKMVAGRRGARKFTDPEAAEQLMKGARLKRDVMYTSKLITPTQAEKILAKQKPRFWTRLKELIVQPEGKPSLAPVEDKRPAVLNLASFENEDSAEGLI